MDYKKSYYLYFACLLGGALLLFAGAGIGSKWTVVGNIIGYIGAAAILGGIVQMCLFYKCPKCGKHLGKGTRPDYCPSCGERLDWE